MESKDYSYLKYVTVTIGGNDICLAKKTRKKTEPEEFQKNIKEFFLKSLKEFGIMTKVSF